MKVKLITFTLMVTIIILLLLPNDSINNYNIDNINKDSLNISYNSLNVSCDSQSFGEVDLKRSYGNLILNHDSTIYMLNCLMNELDSATIDTNKVRSFVNIYNNYPFEDVEVSEFANEVAIRLFVTEPEVMATAIINDKNTYKNILIDISSPILDTPDITEVKNAIIRSNIDSNVKNKILDDIDKFATY